MTSAQRVAAALCHGAPDRTPLFEIFQPYHPIHWDVCGHTVATDMAMAWDALAQGIRWEELLEAHIQAEYAVCKFFGLDMVRLNGPPGRREPRPTKTGKTAWQREGRPYHLNPRTKLVELANPGEAAADSQRISEDEFRRTLEEPEPPPPEGPGRPDPFLAGVRRLAKADGLDWVYMAEIGAGTGVAFYPPFLLIWMIEEPELCERWLQRQKRRALAQTRQMIEAGCTVVAIGGDCSCDKGPFISPALYRRFILPVIQEHVALIHSLGAKAVYTSDGNHWAIKNEFFFESGIDGYKEVDKAAGMTWPRLIAEGVADRVCIIGNIDARRTLCLGSPREVRQEVLECLSYGRRSPGGHILHASHSVHEDVKVENYRAMVDAYREYFDLERLPR